MDNLWEMIAKARGVELDEEFIWDYKGFKYKHRITTYGLQILVEDKWFGTHSSTTAFIEGAGTIEKIPFRPQEGGVYYTFYLINKEVAYSTWDNTSVDYARLIAGIVFRTREEAEAYIPIWQERISKL